MPPTQQVTQFLSFLTLLSIAFLLYLLITKAILKKQFKKLSWFNKNYNFIKKIAMPLAFLVGLTATLGSLYYSEIAGWDPCKLCWFQRIFMYPIPLLLGIAIYYKDNKITRYAVPMSLIGGIIALYHYVLQRIPKIAEACSAGHEGVSCSINYIFTHNFITIPMMALVAFVMVLVLVMIIRE